MNRVWTLSGFVLLLLLMKEEGINAQGNWNQKKRVKSPTAFASIAQQDVNGQSVSVAELQQLEKAYLALGDKQIAREFLVQAAFARLVSNPSAGEPEVSDSVYVRSLVQCPYFGKVREADPLLMMICVLHAYAQQNAKDIMSGYNVFLQWQKDSVPHSPWGNNEAPEYLTGPDKTQWDLLYTTNWLKNYPTEVSIVSGAYKRFYDKWKKYVTGQTDNVKFLNAVVTQVGLVPGAEIEPLLNAPAKGDKEEGIAYITRKQMLADPGSFIKNTYENLLFREPTAEEKEGLERMIIADERITPQLFYYSLMTSAEYKFY
ncbi:MAG: hypothetical protein U0V74_12090 [Chitinophagales bacterium]